MGIFATIVVGLVAGWLTGKIMRGKGYGLVGDLILGVIGGFVGGWLSSSLLGQNMMTGINPISIIVAVIGAIVVVAVARLLTGRR